MAIQVLAGFVVSVAGAGGGVLLQLCRGVGGAGSSGRGARTTGSPEAITGALVAPDGRHVVVPYTGGGCVVGARLTATETGSKVTLVLRQVLSGASVCPADLIVGLTVRVTLPHPLWGRALVDGSTDRPIHYFDGRKLLRVTYLPPGYRFSAYQPYPAPAVTAWEREFVSPGRATAPVEVEQIPGKHCRRAVLAGDRPRQGRRPTGRAERAHQRRAGLRPGDHLASRRLRLSSCTPSGPRRAADCYPPRS